MHKNIVFLLNKSEITAGTPGASLGPEAILTAARHKKSNFFSEFEIQQIADCNHLLDTKTDYEFAKRIDGLIEIYEALKSKVFSLLLDKKFPFIIAGDHGSAGGTIAGVKAAFPNKRIGVVWIDAHADIHTPFTTPTGNMHGMPLATALNIDNLEVKVNEVSQETSRLWGQLKNIGSIAPKIDPNDLVYIAVRDTEQQEDFIIDKLKIKNYSVEEVRKKGVSTICSEIQHKLIQCDVIYISFDVDSMDPELTSFGTGTPVINGLSPDEAKEILVNFAQNEKTVCIELVEVNPCLDDKKNKMAEVALDIVESVTNTLNKRN